MQHHSDPPEPFPHNEESQLRKLGLTTVMRKGVVGFMARWDSATGEVNEVTDMGGWTRTSRRGRGRGAAGGRCKLGRW